VRGWEALKEWAVRKKLAPRLIFNERKGDR
jgi:hypothetical protein